MGISVTDETLQRSEAAHRTPPGKRPTGTEINPSLLIRIWLKKQIIRPCIAIYPL
ncbi:MULTISPECIES: hypothetical protein [Lysinibacillus]|uniref:hypothetical protein n=1 Tax=Lysinibacillus TaxID=400634 RepID=UPI001CBF0DE8|nr:hypothetical protein [Lysinibacillus sphaericus]